MDQLRELWAVVAVNRFVASGIILVASILVAYVVDFIVARVCREWARRTTTTVDDSFVELAHNPVRVTVVVFGLWLITRQLGIPGRPAVFATAALKSIALIVWTVFAVRFVSLLFDAASRSESVRIVQPRTQPLLDNLAKVVFFAGALYFVFVFWDINISGWLASAGIIGIAVGFAAKDTLANLFSGIFILADAPYQVGDYINLDTGERGEVTHIGIRSTRILTRDDVEVTIPNAVIANAKIVNETGGRWPKERVRVKVGVAYGSDVDRLREVLEELADGHPDTCAEPKPRVRFRQFGDSSLDFELLVWIDEPVLRGRVIDSLNVAIYKALAQEGIEIPYPKRDVYIREMPGTTPGRAGP
jgi:small-conductance mechanosensitive channel